MIRLAAVVLLLATSGMLAAQAQPEILNTWNVRWVDVSSRAEALPQFVAASN